MTSKKAIPGKLAYSTTLKCLALPVLMFPLVLLVHIKF